MKLVDSLPPFTLRWTAGSHSHTSNMSQHHLLPSKDWIFEMTSGIQGWLNQEVESLRLRVGSFNQFERDSKLMGSDIIFEPGFGDNEIA